MNVYSVRWFARRAVRRRDNGDSVDISDGCWLIRVPNDCYPNTHSRQTGKRDRGGILWEPWPEADRMDAVMPRPFGASVGDLSLVSRCQFDSVSSFGSPYILTWTCASGPDFTACPVTYSLDPIKRVAFQLEYLRQLEAAQLFVWATPEQEIDKPFVIADGVQVVGSIMPLRWPEGAP